MRPHFLPAQELHPDLMRRQRDFRRLLFWVVGSFVMVSLTSCGIGYLAAIQL